MEKLNDWSLYNCIEILEKMDQEIACNKEVADNDYDIIKAHIDYLIKYLNAIKEFPIKDNDNHFKRWNKERTKCVFLSEFEEY